MFVTRGWTTAAVAAWVAMVAAHVAAQATQAPPPTMPPTTAPAPPAGRGQGRGGGGGGGVFPAQQRPPGDPALIEKGRALYSIVCTACHGADLRGGQLNGPNLLRSQVALADQQGELIVPIIQGSRAEKGMAAIPISPDDGKAVAEYIHSVLATIRNQGMPPPTEAPPPDALVGDAGAGEAYFKTTCSSCHSPSGDLQGIGSRFPNAKALQNFWVPGGTGRGGGRGTAGAPNPRAVTATVTLPSGEKVEGRVVRIDDFLVTLALADDTVRSIRRNGDTPKVDVRDPLAPHRELLAKYTNKNMRDVTAYLVTLK
jgi:cytochrome c oxidase cbb3-type subunit 3